MSNPILNLDSAPEDCVERIAWLGGVMEQVRRELDQEFQVAYFNARLTSRLPEARALNLHSRKRVMAWTRAENERRGRMIRWGDAETLSDS